jgi:hypothetical protein
MSFSDFGTDDFSDHPDDSGDSHDTTYGSYDSAPDYESDAALEDLHHGDWGVHESRVEDPDAAGAGLAEHPVAELPHGTDLGEAADQRGGHAAEPKFGWEYKTPDGHIETGVTGSVPSSWTSIGPG